MERMYRATLLMLDYIAKHGDSIESPKAANLADEIREELALDAEKRPSAWQALWQARTSGESPASPASPDAGGVVEATIDPAAVDDQEAESAPSDAPPIVDPIDNDK